MGCGHCGPGASACTLRSRKTQQGAALLSFWELIPMRDRLKKRIRRLEKASQELIPIEDFITPWPNMELPCEESEQRALLLKKWSLYQHQEHKKERDAITSMLESQQEALQELLLISPELHAVAKGPDYTPPISSYQPPEGRYHDITKVYTQVEFKK
ncbi:unnamed protein product [Nyctereutes procyonoides]|uniref:Large ribosomal subunit protein mL40 n=1 Tax=Nyctereutes procyonoides TaxID=34880 RepID=A0A811YK82_NYCPR|nr:unnamed protein product [Nyctereutes procyonoides]